jgi:hypothetical protein
MSGECRHEWLGYVLINRLTPGSCYPFIGHVHGLSAAVAQADQRGLASGEGLDLRVGLGMHHSSRLPRFSVIPKDLMDVAPVAEKGTCAELEHVPFHSLTLTCYQVLHRFCLAASHRLIAVSRILKNGRGLLPTAKVC